MSDLGWSDIPLHEKMTDQIVQKIRKTQLFTHVSAKLVQKRFSNQTFLFCAPKG